MYSTTLSAVAADSSCQAARYFAIDQARTLLDQRDSCAERELKLLKASMELLEPVEHRVCRPTPPSLFPNRGCIGQREPVFTARDVEQSGLPLAANSIEATGGDRTPGCITVATFCEAAECAPLAELVC